MKMDKYKWNIVFKQWQAPGDLLMLSVALRDLHKSYPGKFKTDVFCCYPEVFFNNPYISHLPKDGRVPVIDLKYDGIRSMYLKTGIHFSDAFIILLNDKFKLDIMKTSIKPDIHLTQDEKSDKILKRLGIEKPFWIINAGVKNDIPIKGYPPAKWQEVVGELKNNGVNLVQVGSINDLHPIIGCKHEAVGKTENLRDFFSLVYHSQGTIGHVSMHMHVAAAFDKPSVILGGGREDWRWEAYPNHKYFHTIGQYDCCLNGGCWISYIQDCEHRYRKTTPYADCIASVSVEQIVYEVLTYNTLLD